MAKIIYENGKASINSSSKLLSKLELLSQGNGLEYLYYLICKSNYHLIALKKTPDVNKETKELLKKYEKAPQILGIPKNSGDEIIVNLDNIPVCLTSPYLYEFDSLIVTLKRILRTSIKLVLFALSQDNRIPTDFKLDRFVNDYNNVKKICGKILENYTELKNVIKRNEPEIRKLNKGRDILEHYLVNTRYRTKAKLYYTAAMSYNDDSTKDFKEFKVGELNPSEGQKYYDFTINFVEELFSSLEQSYLNESG